MKQIIKYIAACFTLLPYTIAAQEVLPIDSILRRIERNNLILQSYELKATAYTYTADAATAWMPPAVGAGTFMTPYPGQKIMEARDRGNLMLEIEQEIPNAAKLRSKKRYIESQGNIERASREVTLNELKAQAKILYYNWLIAKERIDVLHENQRIMVTLKKIEEVRYPYNQSLLGGVYKSEARLGEIESMLRMQVGNIERARAGLNGLMNEPGNRPFEIDTTFQPHFAPTETYDTAKLATVRKDVLKMNEGIRSMQLNIESMNNEKKPDFSVRFNHMYPLAGVMPQAFNVIGMITIPIVPWSSKMYKSQIKAMEYNIRSMEKERSAMLQETQGTLYAMQYEIHAMHDRIYGLEEKIIPALKKSLDANFALYQENKLSLLVVIDSWEALNMMYMNLLDDKLKHYEMIVDYEKQLYR